MGLKWPLWWRFSDDTKTMLHEGSGDSVRLLGSTPGLQSGSLDGLRLKLEYSDGARQHVYPVTVDVRALPRDAVSRSWGNVTNLNKELTGPVHIFRVSFDLANRAWQARSPGAGKHLPYGIWRRLEEHVTDALLCWPGAAPFDGNARLVATREGWNNGEWRSNYYRVTENCPVKFPAGAASLPHYPDGYWPADFNQPCPAWGPGVSRGFNLRSETYSDMQMLMQIAGSGCCYFSPGSHVMSTYGREAAYHVETQCDYLVMETDDITLAIEGGDVHQGVEVNGMPVIRYLPWGIRYLTIRDGCRAVAVAAKYGDQLDLKWAPQPLSRPIAGTKFFHYVPTMYICRPIPLRLVRLVTETLTHALSGSGRVIANPSSSQSPAVLEIPSPHIYVQSGANLAKTRILASPDLKSTDHATAFPGFFE